MAISPPIRVAILGATGHIAKGLISALRQANLYDLLLFARSPESITQFLEADRHQGNYSIKQLGEFNGYEYDTVINCIGIGDPGKLKEAGASIFALTERYDNMALDYLAYNPKALYINMSSGVAYGADFSVPVDKSSAAQFNINELAMGDYYGIAKLYAEAKHRSLTHLNIVDLRVFSYFSRFIDLEAQFFMSEVISCVLNDRVFTTGPQNIIRDYVHPQDFASLIENCIAAQSLNDVFDVYSQKPVTKFEVLDYFAENYKLKYEIRDDASGTTITGSKDHYYSVNKKAQNIGYCPKYTSLECISQESAILIG